MYSCPIFSSRFTIVIICWIYERTNFVLEFDGADCTLLMIIIDYVSKNK